MYVLGGNSTTFHSFDPVSSTWTALADMSKARINFSFVALPDRIVILGGEGSDNRSREIEEYNIALDK
jgi:hypothetical protein